MENKQKHKENLSISRRLRDDFLAGDDNSYSTIYRMYVNDLYAFGLSFHATAELIEDAIHDVFIEIYTHRKILANVENLKIYLMTAFRNRLLFRMKQSAIYVEMKDNVYEMEEHDCQSHLIEQEWETEKQELMQCLLSKLNGNQREALYHHFIENLSYKEIASVMHINYQSAKNLVHRSINKLRALVVNDKRFSTSIW
ncbi:MAG: sigma-70 family RNA polymerase sigma factor [Dysgonamonadaceae bacterium]|nr:sigma-70 family RNA polymerase sigma factor [Dysgonamonadaceae bacterium]